MRDLEQIHRHTHLLLQQLASTPQPTESIFTPPKPFESPRWSRRESRDPNSWSRDDLSYGHPNPNYPFRGWTGPAASPSLSNEVEVNYHSDLVSHLIRALRGHGFKTERTNVQYSTDGFSPNTVTIGYKFDAGVGEWDLDLHSVLGTLTVGMMERNYRLNATPRPDGFYLIRDGFKAGTVVILQKVEQTATPAGSPPVQSYRPMPDHKFGEHGAEIKVPEDIRNQMLDNLQAETELARQQVHDSILVALKAAEYTVVKFQLSPSIEGLNQPSAHVFHYATKAGKPNLTWEVLGGLLRDLEAQWRKAGKLYNFTLEEAGSGIAANINITATGKELIVLYFVPTGEVSPGTVSLTEVRTYVNDVVIKQITALGFKVVSEHLSSQYGMTLHYSGDALITGAMLEEVVGQLASTIAMDGHSCGVEVTNWKEGPLLTIVIENTTWSYGFELIPSTPSAVAETLNDVNKQLLTERQAIDAILNTVLHRNQYYVHKTQHLDDLVSVVRYSPQRGSDAKDINKEVLDELLVPIHSELVKAGLSYSMISRQEQNDKVSLLLTSVHSSTAGVMEWGFLRN